MNWTGGLSGVGYGQFYVGGWVVGAHRVAWEFRHGPISKSHVIRHVVCDNPRCVNVEHLAPGTQLDNMEDMAAAGRGWVKFSDAEIGLIWGRALLGLTPSEIADKCDFSVSHVARVLNVDARPNAIADELDRDLERREQAGEPVPEWWGQYCPATTKVDVSDNQDGCRCGVRLEVGRSPTVG